jgi:hypothetical protein
VADTVVVAPATAVIGARIVSPNAVVPGAPTPNDTPAPIDMPIINYPLVYLY